MVERVLIVDDDPVQRRLLEAMAVRFGYRALTADGGDAALAVLGDPQKSRIDCVILDLVMPDLDGLGMLAKMREHGMRMPVIVQTAHGGIDNVVSAMRAGAADFVVKPVGPERLQVSLRNALAQSALEGELQRIKHARAGTLTFRDLVSRSPQIAAQALRHGGDPDPDSPWAPSITADLASFAPGSPTWAATVPASSQPRGVLPLFDDEGQIRPLEDIESEVIRFAISHYRGQMSEVARRLHIGRSTLYRKLENLGLDGENPESDEEAGLPGEPAQCLPGN